MSPTQSRPSAAPPASRRGSFAAAALLFALAAGIYAPTIGDYFIGDDFDLLQSFYGKPASYFFELLYSNESGDIWKTWGIDATQGQGFLRPFKIWLLKLQFEVWGTWAGGFHLFSVLLFGTLVLLVRAVVARVVPERPHAAFLAAAVVAIHPLFSEVVPFITASEELIAICLGMAALLAFLRLRDGVGAAWPVYALYALSLLTKESGISIAALAFVYDLAHTRFLRLDRRELWTRVRFYLPFVPIVAAYFALRWTAFGNFKGGDIFPTGYDSWIVYTGFHRLFYRAFFEPTMFLFGDLRGVGLAVGLAVLVLLGYVVWDSGNVASRRIRDLIYFGPLWYVTTTAVLFGSFFAMRRNGLPLIGLAIFFALLFETLYDLGRVRRRRLATGALLALLAVAWLPPTFANRREFSRAAAIVREAREEIEARTAHLPPGSTVLLKNVPQWEVPPYYFGWALLSALGRPFTATDLARRCRVVDEEHMRLNRDRRPLPEAYDFVVEFERGRWIGPEQKQRRLDRLVRSGVLRRVRTR